VSGYTKAAEICLEKLNHERKSTMEHCAKVLQTAGPVRSSLIAMRPCEDFFKSNSFAQDALSFHHTQCRADI
jgi:hypothetical protein